MVDLSVFRTLILLIALASCVPEPKLHVQDDAGSIYAHAPRDGGDDARSAGPSAGMDAPGGPVASGTDAGNDAHAPAATSDAATPTDPDGGSLSVPPAHDGLWTGITDQGRLLTFRVFSRALTAFSADYEVEADAVVGGQPAICTAQGQVSTTFGTPQELSAADRFDIGPIASNPAGYSVRGGLDGDGSAEGVFELSYSGPNCNAGTVIHTWSAEHVVCGDGSIQWPETCDAGDAADGDGCSRLCQLDASEEVEPNDSPPAAATPASTDALLAGSLPSGADVDVFALRNTRPGSLAVSLETHGETVGMCHAGPSAIDTLIEIVDDGGNVLAFDDDGSRALLCSKLSYMLSAGQTVFVRVSSVTGEPIERYHLHIAFQHS